jgi:hypothetical protein
VSDNIANGEVFTALPDVMVKSAWELIFLLLISPEQNEDIYQALFDTGLCPRQGNIFTLIPDTMRKYTFFIVLSSRTYTIPH